MLKPGFTFELW